MNLQIDRFIKFIPSEESVYLLTQKGHAFRLLTIIAEAARRYEGGSDGLRIGEAFIGGFENYDMSEQNYRTAKEILVRRSHIEIVETCRTRKKVTNGVTTVGTKVRLLSTTVYDINIIGTNDRSNDLPTTDPRPTNDKQEQQEVKNVNKQQQPLTPSLPLPVCSPVGLFSCIEGLVLSVQEKQKLCNFPELDVIRAVQVLKEQKKAVDSIMGFLLRAIENKWQPKSNPKIELSDEAKSNRDKLMRYAGENESQLQVKDIKISDRIDHAMFGVVKIPYEMEFKKFKELVITARRQYNLIPPERPPNLARVIEDHAPNGKVVNLQHAGSIASNLVENIQKRN